MTEDTVGDFWRAVEADRTQRRAAYGVNCPRCVSDHPKRTPTILLPQQRCRVCGYRGQWSVGNDALVVAARPVRCGGRWVCAGVSRCGRVERGC